jgi:hypothetical protein
MFNGIWLVASESIMVQGREVEPGERFQIPRIDAGALLAMRKATIAPKFKPAPEPPKRRRGRPRKIQTAAITAESGYPPAEHLRYQRRDLEAEE